MCPDEPGSTARTNIGRPDLERLRRYAIALGVWVCVAATLRDALADAVWVCVAVAVRVALADGV